MAKSLLLGASLLALVTACDDKARPPGNPPTTYEQDGLWNLAPAGARGGVVASSRGIAMLEDGLAMVRAALAKAPELAVIEAQIDGVIAQVAGMPEAKLADMGLSRRKGAAIFAAGDGEMVAVLPIADRDKFLSRVQGTKGATPDAPDRVGEIACKQIRGSYACAYPHALLDTLGKGQLKAQLGKIAPARGDIELVGTELAFGTPQSPGGLVAVLQLERGGGTLRGTATGLPAAAVKRFVSQARARPDSAMAASFAVLDTRALLATMPIEQMFGPELGGILANLTGPITIGVPAGATGFDARMPLADGAAGQRLVEGCTSLPGIGPIATVKDGVCHFPIPNANLEVDVWMDPDGKTLRLGQKDLQPGPSVPRSAVGRALAANPWAMGFWGRGTVMGSSQMPGVPGSVDPQTALILRGLSMVNEVGLGIRAVAADRVDFIASLRTIFANPDAVIEQLLAVTPDDIAAARAGDKAKAIALAHAGAPFAQDYKAGQMGLAIPYMMMGTLAAIAMPAIMELLRSSEPAETEQMPSGPPGVAQPIPQ